MSRLRTYGIPTMSGFRMSVFRMSGLRVVISLNITQRLRGPGRDYVILLSGGGGGCVLIADDYGGEGVKKHAKKLITLYVNDP